VAQHLDVAVDREFLARIDRRNPGLDQARAGDAGGMQVRAGSFQRADEMRTEEITGRFAGDQTQVDHRMMPRSARARKSSSCCTSACLAASGENPRRLSPSLLRPCGAAGWPAAMTKGGMSLNTTLEIPVITWAPTLQNWCTPVKPPRIAQSPTSEWPASDALLAKMVRSPTTQSCAMWT